MHFKNRSQMMISLIHNLLVVYQIVCNVPTYSSAQNILQRQIPKIKLENLQAVLDNPERDLNLEDLGGKLGIIEISGLGSNYSDALTTLHINAPKCIGNDQNRLPRQINLPDGSYRKTYGTTIKTYLDCLDMDILSQTFDAIDSAMIKLLNKVNEKYFGEPLSYTLGENNIPLVNAPQKEHIHVYTKTNGKDILVGNRRSEYLVPFHVDNGFFLIITPFPEHGMDVKLSNGVTVSTNNTDLDSAFVLIGRGLTDWLMKDSILARNYLFPVPHSVATLSHSDSDTRTVYARMKVAPPSATSGRFDLKDSRITFQEFFMDTAHSDLIDSKNQKLEIKETNDAGHGGHRVTNERNPSGEDDVNELFMKTLQHQCNEGEAYCWSICQSLPTDCNQIEDATCIDGHMLRCK